MSHDQKPARVRVVTDPRARAASADGGDGAASAVAGVGAGSGGDAPAATGGARGMLVLGGLFVVAAGVGGACAAVFLP
ncbi:hypothetical protein ABIC16_003597 [Sphingomonas sp. PvP055]|uniref:hypothetical protein n=1 Tax=Sphingomonas sp. PvP055 TaxID=3156391 RepID=UPI0033918D03